MERRQRKMEWKALEKDVQENPDAKLIERAKKFGVHPTAIWYALKKIQITRKKKKSGYQKKKKKKKKKNIGIWPNKKEGK